MMEYINQKETIEKIRRMPRAVNPDLVQYSLVKGIISGMPAADVAPVVRCWECEHWKDWGACGHPDNGWDAPPMGPEDFCSRGKKQTDL